MRLTPIVMLATLGIATAACGKKETPPKPATNETKKPEPTKTAPADAATAAEDTAKPAAEDTAEPEPEDTAKPAPEDTAKVEDGDRTEWVTKVLSLYAEGKMDESFADLADDVVWHDLGNPMASKLEGKQAVIDHHKKLSGNWSEVSFKAKRVINLGDAVAVQAVWGGKHTGDGMGPPTNKNSSVEGAFVLHFNDDGKVDEVWNAFDGLTTMSQIGALEGMPEAPLAAVPESVETVDGESNQAMVDKYKAVSSKWTPDTMEEMMREMGAEDMVQYDSMTGKEIKGLEANIAYMKEMTKMMGDFSGTVHQVWSAGDWLVAVEDLDFTYKGGIPGVEAKDQKVKVPFLAVMMMADGKMKMRRDYTNSMGMMAQLGVDMGMGGSEDGDGGEDGGVDKVGIESCDKYLSTYAACLEALPEAARGPATDAFKKATSAWKEALDKGGEPAREALDKACKSAWDTAKGTMGQMCPDVKWE